MPFLTQEKTNWKYILIVGTLAAISGGIFVWQYFKMPEKKIPEEKTQKGILELTAQQIKDLDYNINNPSFQPGQYPDYGFYLIEEGTYYKDSIVWGDLNNDGHKDAVVVLKQSSGGSAVGVLIGAVINDNGKPVFVDLKDLGDRTHINNIKIENGVITIDMFVKGPDDPGCCPSVAKRANYKLVNNKIKEITPVVDQIVSSLKFFESPDPDFKTVGIDKKTNWNIGRSENYGFEVKYPDSVSPSKIAPLDYLVSDGWTLWPREGIIKGKDKGKVIVSFVTCEFSHIPPSEPYNSFTSELRIGVSSHPDEIKNCFNFWSRTPTEVKINGTEFKRFEVEDRALGHEVRAEVYRTIHNNMCFSIEKLEYGYFAFSAHCRDCEEYFQKFDSCRKITGQMLSTFRFLK